LNWIEISPVSSIYTFKTQNLKSFDKHERFPVDRFNPNLKNTYNKNHNILYIPSIHFEESEVNKEKQVKQTT
jgi:hypothetical protein